jgi:anti-sigma factor RsiW
MSCRNVRRLLPLFVGRDLREGKNGEVESHLESCETCRAEYEAYRRSYATTKEWLAEDKLAWDEADWKRTLHRAVNLNGMKAVPFILWPFRRVWAFALMAAVAAGLSWVLIRPAAVRHFGRSETMTLASSGTRLTEQDVVSMTMVSQETGLKIVWFFDKNFDLEDKQQ